MALLIAIAALSVGGATFLAGWSDWRALVAMWAASMAVAIPTAILMGRDPEVRRYRQEYKDWREQQLARGRSKWSLALEMIRTTTAEGGLTRRELVFLLVHVLIVLGPVGAAVSLISLDDRLW